MDFSCAHRISERAEMVWQEPGAGPGTGASDRACVRGPRNGTIHEARSHCPNDRGRLAHATWIGALAAKLRPHGAELDLRRQDREPGLWRVHPRRFRAADRRGHVLSRAGSSRRQMLANSVQEIPPLLFSLKGTVSNYDKAGVKPKLNRPRISNTCQPRPWKGHLAVD